VVTDILTSTAAAVQLGFLKPLESPLGLCLMRKLRSAVLSAKVQLVFFLVAIPEEDRTRCKENAALLSKVVGGANTAQRDNLICT
jgi:hypothetical protein